MLTATITITRRYTRRRPRPVGWMVGAWAYDIDVQRGGVPVLLRDPGPPQLWPLRHVAMRADGTLEAPRG